VCEQRTRCYIASDRFRFIFEGEHAGVGAVDWKDTTAIWERKIQGRQQFRLEKMPKEGEGAMAEKEVGSTGVRYNAGL
jgi:hypothetical protein